MFIQLCKTSENMENSENVNLMTMDEQIGQHCVYRKQCANVRKL